MLMVVCAPLSSARVIWKGNGSRQVALTFDDGPTLGVTDKILEILKKEEVKATFFVLGRKVEQEPGLLLRISQDGHEIGNHTYNHTRTSCINGEKLLKETQRTSELVSNIAGVPVFLFRPPHGKIDRQKRKLLEKQGYNIVFWSLGADDYYREGRGIRPPKSIIWRVVSRVRGGDIVLLHDNSRQIVEALPGMIKQLKRKGYVFAKVSELNQAGRKKKILSNKSSDLTAFSSR
jgi:peptidoglycan/xylan/chitin deacetylase (PgdA/CDA1 family)